ncbi:CBS domain-containing protein [Candidatus Pacearchaeota archaeon]|nr:CBS domain-containing protein [Candidatus Pacearchaeota archaeon]
MKVREVMGKPNVVSPETTILEAAKIMAEKDVTTLFVIEGQKVIGIITDMDIIKRCVIQNKKAGDVKAKDIMTSKLVTVDADDNVEYAVNVMLENKIRRLPVVSKGRFVGIITTDYISAHADELGVDSLF